MSSSNEAKYFGSGSRDVDHVEEYESDLDSTIGTDVASSTVSISSSVFNYKYENGRRYHAYREGSYPLPNDEAEQDRLDLYHHVWLLLLGGSLYTAPLDHPQRILDIGTGTGIWAIDCAEVPLNCRFEVDDCELEWTYDRNFFDFIHCRNMSGSFSDWGKIVGQCFRHTKPGGYTEVQEFEYVLLNGDNKPVPSDSDFNRWWVETTGAAARCGKPFMDATLIEEYMSEVGFINMTRRTEKWLFAPWSEDPKEKEVGRYAQLGILQALIPYSVALLTRFSGWTKEEVDILCAKATSDVQNPKHQFWCKAHFVYGQKPEDAG